MADITDKTIDGLLAYCEWLVDKGYSASSQVEPWKTAVKKVFYTVEGEDYGSLSLDSLDIDDIVGRFKKLAAGQYKHESLAAYENRLRRAIETHDYFLANGKPPAFRQVTKKSTDSGPSQPKAQAKALAAVPDPAPAASPPAGGDGFFDLQYPLESGRMALLRLPKRLSKTDVDRLVTVIQSLEEQRQIPAHTGEDTLAA